LAAATLAAATLAPTALTAALAATLAALAATLTALPTLTAARHRDAHAAGLRPNLLLATARGDAHDQADQDQIAHQWTIHSHLNECRSGSTLTIKGGMHLSYRAHGRSSL
jgi:hypothetical protein